MTCFLGVEKSFTGRRWQARPYDEREALALAQRFTLPDFIARSLSARGVGLDEAKTFLEPRLRDLMPDPSGFKDMGKAAARFAEAIKNNRKIAVFGDYDVDGATSSALLIRFARSLGAELKLYIPDRISEGYGPNISAMRKLADEGISFVVCVDCGTTAYEPLSAAEEMGLEVIVIDHHAAEPALPRAYAVVNPNRIDEDNCEKFGTLAAVGVTYLFVVAVNRLLREEGWYEEKNAGNSGEKPKEPNLLEWLDLVALGTVCDVVKLTGLNRAFVSQGLKVMQSRNNVGIRALAEAAGYNGVMDSYAAGFILGPRVNAGGRVAKSDQGARLLSTEDSDEAKKIAEDLNKYNDERREIEAATLAEAEAMLAGESSPLAFVAKEGWHAGVIGIVASRIKDKFMRPSIVVAIDGEAGKGSGRSFGNVDLGSAVLAARQAGLLVNGGGHKMAAGLTVEKEKIGELKNFLNERIAKQIEAEPMVPSLSVDGLLSGVSLRTELVEKISLLAPFGTGNSEPRFAIADCKIVRADMVGEKHVKIIATCNGERINAIAFRAMDSELGIALLSSVGKFCHLAGRARINEWRDEKSVQLLIDDAVVA